jgi:hypothetical protein
LNPWAILLCGAILWGAERTTRADEQPRDTRHVAQLVDQLGSPRFMERQLATETLSSLGLSVEAPVKQAMVHRDPEVRLRARQILRVIRHTDRQRLITAFIAGAEVADDAELPGWSAYQQIAGSGDDARQLYVQLLEEEWEFLDAVYQSEPAVAADLMAGRIMVLDAASRRKQPVTVGNIASLLLVAAREDLELTNQAVLMSLCYRSSDFDASIRSGPSRDALRALLGRVIAGSAGNTGDPYLTQRFHFSLYYDLKEGLDPARQVLREGLGIPHVRQYALLVLGKLGEPRDDALIATLLEDPSLITSQNRGNRQRITTQVRDVALAVLVHRRGGDFEDYGMRDVRTHATTLLQLTTVGFANDKEREQAIAAWNLKHGDKVRTEHLAPPTPGVPPDPAHDAPAAKPSADNGGTNPTSPNPVERTGPVPAGPHDE